MKEVKLLFEKILPKSVVLLDTRSHVKYRRGCQARLRCSIKKHRRAESLFQFHVVQFLRTTSILW